MAASDFPPELLPLVVAHRGASATFPENTLESFTAAVEAGAQAVEFDVRLSADGVPVVVHDPDVSRCTDGTGFVHELTVAELKRLDAGGGRVPRAEIPTLREALDLLSGRVGVDIEIKNIPGEPAFDSPEEAVVAATLRALDAAAFSGPVLVSSFNWLSIERCRELAPDLPTGFLTIAAMDPAAALVYAREAGHGWVLPQADAVGAAGAGFVEEAHGDGIRVGTWVADEERPMAGLFELGVDAVATNDPALGVRVRSGFRP
jgi:glycerophosphoryl diester phosphodiesterase